MNQNTLVLNLYSKFSKESTFKTPRKYEVTFEGVVMKKTRFQLDKITNFTEKVIVECPVEGKECAGVKLTSFETNLDQKASVLVKIFKVSLEGELLQLNKNVYLNVAAEELSANYQYILFGLRLAFAMIAIAISRQYFVTLPRFEQNETLILQRKLKAISVLLIFMNEPLSVLKMMPFSKQTQIISLIFYSVFFGFLMHFWFTTLRVREISH